MQSSNPSNSNSNNLFSTDANRQMSIKKPKTYSQQAHGGASERSERGRSALFKNPLFFEGW